MRLAGVKPVCKVCGYDKYVEVSHIKHIKFFIVTTLLKEVNAITNLSYMCPTHHKEYDRNIMSKEDLVKLIGVQIS